MDQPVQAPKSLPSRGIYLLPNLLTTAALFSGFYAVIAVMKGHFDVAALAIFIAMIADGLDGRVARMTNTQTAFGAEYDSLSDLLAFGVAPALLAYGWSLASLGKIGWVAAFLYTAATALRLARFNTQANDIDKRYFQGLPCPPAAAVITSTIWLLHSYEISGSLFAVPIAILVVCVAGLMVSTIRYHSFKQVDLKGRVPFIAIVIIVLILAMIATDPLDILFAMIFCYAASGPIITLWKVKKMRSAKKLAKKG